MAAGTAKNPEGVKNKVKEQYMVNTETDLQKGTTGVKFSGGVLAIFLFPFWAVPFVIITLGIATPWVICIVMRWICNNTTKDEKRFRFKGTGGGLFGRFIIWWLLSLITLGIYSFWSTRNQIRWVVENIEMAD
ncbi:MAG: DUF898 domain-containing protein [Spirochaetaceae bacterium]|nr:DUF898 domain-containing protein [Spirochaetaceae bacterium]